MKLLSIFGWIFQVLIGTYCLFTLVSGAIDLAIGLMFSLYTFAFIQERLEMYYTDIKQDA